MISVIGPAYTSDPKQYERLLNSARRVGAPEPHLFGLNQLHPGDVLVLEVLIQELRNCTTPYVICTDTYDTMFCRWNADEVMEAIDDSSGILFSCEAACWPGGEWCSAYPAPVSPWSFINGGQSCGRKGDLISLYESVREFRETGNCQERLHRIYAQNPQRIDLDRECRIFQSMSAPRPEDAIQWDEEGGGVVNAIQDTYPMLLHFNGRTPGIDYWYEKVMS